MGMMAMVTAHTYPRDLQALLSQLPDLSPNDQSLIERAYRKAEAAHDGQKRKSGEPYFTHCVAVAGILAEMKMDSETIAAALMHDIIEDTNISLADLKREFGPVIARLVDGVTKLTNLPIKSPELDGDPGRHSGAINRENEYFRKMFLTMDNDVRVVLIKLADRLHNMRTLGYMPTAKQVRTAHETMDIFAPLANRLGIWQFKWELEDLSFRYLHPDSYRAIARDLDERRVDRERYVKHIADTLRQELAKYNITDVSISARPKHIYSIYRKMDRKNLPLDQIHDVRAIRVIVPEQTQCYLVLGIVHQLWRPIPGEFDDYIAAPKDNFYRSLHTAVLDSNGKTVEVQIRTWEMHEDAEYGIAAHWRYKEGRGRDDAFEKRITYLRRLMENTSEGREDADTFLDRIKQEVFQDRVYAFTPKGDVIDLPVGSTPLDFAYHIHTDIGNRCRGAKIRGQLVNLTYQLKTGDQVEILTAKRGGPSMDWLNTDLGYVKTSRARAKIRHWFRRQNREKHITMGREMLERDLKRLGVNDRMSFDAVRALFDYDSQEDFLAAIGAGDVTGTQITQRILNDESRREREAQREQGVIKRRNKPGAMVDSGQGVLVMGSGGLLVNLAKCCNPMPGDNIIGYVTRGRGVTVHRTDCPNLKSLGDAERQVDVSWRPVNDEYRYSVPVEIIAHDRSGLLRDITTLIADERINIASVEVLTRQHIATIHLKIEISDNQQLTRILAKIENIPNVVEARRRNQ